MIGFSSGYWLASPSDYPSYSPPCVMNVNVSGSVGTNYYSDENYGFRPLVLLDSNYTLEKTKDSNGNDAFKIVEQ